MSGNDQLRVSSLGFITGSLMILAGNIWVTAAGKAFARDLITIYSPTLGIGRGLFPMNVMSNWLAFGFLSLGMLRTADYPRWLSWSGLALGAIGFILGIIMVFTGREAIWNFFTILAFLSLFWLFSLGIWLARKAWSRPFSK
jgi:hypothetical protein